MSLCYRVILANPTPHRREMTIPQGVGLGRDEERTTTQEEVRVDVEPYSRIGVLFDTNGFQITDVCSIDDIRVEEIDNLETLNIEVNESSIRIIDDINACDLNGSKRTRDMFRNGGLSTYTGIQVDEGRRMGGVLLLSQLSYLRSQRDGQKVGLYSPTALNLRVCNSPDSIYHLVENGQLSLTSCVGSGFDSHGALQLSVQNNTSNSLRVRIPQGAMFEQAHWNGKQNLVVTNEEFIIVGPAQNQTFPLHASCANGSAQAPADDDMNVTPFIFNNLGNTFQDQASVWQSFDGEGGRTARL